MSKWSSAFRDSRWQQMRLQVMDRDGWKCMCCGACGEGTTLNVHHSYYEKGMAPWEYDAETLHTLCQECHEAIHSTQQLLVSTVWNAALMGLANPIRVMAGMIGYADGQVKVPPRGVTPEYANGYKSAIIATKRKLAPILDKMTGRKATRDEVSK